MLNMLRRVADEKRAAAALYAAIAARSREPIFFRELGVADSFDGRFDLLVLHTWLVLEALAAADCGDLQRRLFKGLFVAFDESLRDQGAGDMGIGRRVKAMTSALMGRIKVYQSGEGDEALRQALNRNLYRDASGKDDCAAAVAHYISSARSSLANCDLTQGVADFGPLPRAMESIR